MSSPVPTLGSQRGNVPALDGVRGVAILTVLAHQLCIDGYPALMGASPPSPLASRVRLVLLPFQVGWIGVQIFFVLSGFLITGILLDTRQAENFWSSFYARRALRIFPLYYLLLLVTFVVLPRVVALPAAMLAEQAHQAWYWLYLANVGEAVGAGVEALGHTWSLSVEEQFYLLWPFAVRLLDGRGLVRLCLTIVVLAFAARLGIRLAGRSPALAYELTPCRADALALGALGAVAIRREDWMAWLSPRLDRITAVAAAALGVSALAGGFLARLNPVTQTVGYTALAVFSALVVLRVARGQGKLATFLSSRVLRVYGKYSYAIYVVHLPLHLWFTRTFLAPRLAGLAPGPFLAVQALYFAAGALLLLLIGAVSYRVVERPFLDYKRFFVAKTAGQRA